MSGPGEKRAVVGPEVRVCPDDSAESCCGCYASSDPTAHGGDSNPTSFLLSLYNVLFVTWMTLRADYLNYVMPLCYNMS